MPPLETEFPRAGRAPCPAVNPGRTPHPGSPMCAGQAPAGKPSPCLSFVSDGDPTALRPRGRSGHACAPLLPLF